MEPQPPDQQHCFVLVGLPGCGKSTAAEIIESEIEHRFEAAATFEVSDFVRNLYEQEHADSTNDNALGRWSAQRKEDEGEGYFVGKMADIHHNEPYHPIISGVRSPDESTAARTIFGGDRTTVIAIWTLPDIRFRRKYGDQPNVEHPKWDEFCERNQREIHDWRCVEFFTDDELADYVVPNNDELDSFEHKLNLIVEEEIAGGSKLASAWRDSPLPHDDPEHTAQYL